MSYGHDMATHKGVYEYLKLPWLPNPEETEPDNLDRRGYSWVGAGKKKKRNACDRRDGDTGLMGGTPASAMSAGLLMCGLCGQLAVAPVQSAPHAVACMACVWQKCVGWIGMDFECPPRQTLITAYDSPVRGEMTEYTPEAAFKCRTRSGAWHADGLSDTFIAPATLAHRLIQEQVDTLKGPDAAKYEARRLIKDDMQESMTTIWDETHGLTVEHSATGHWHLNYTDDNDNPHCRLWYQGPSNVVLCRRRGSRADGTATAADIVWQPKSAEEIVVAIQSGNGDVKAFIQRSTGACDMHKLQGRTALDIWDAWVHNPTAETEYARQLGIPPFSLSHLMVTFALVKNSGMEQMIMDDWTRTKDAIPFLDNTSFSFLGRSQSGSLPSILRKSYAGSINSNFEALVDQIDRLP
jgi:hypothetical protein